MYLLNLSPNSAFLLPVLQGTHEWVICKFEFMNCVEMQLNYAHPCSYQLDHRESNDIFCMTILRETTLPILSPVLDQFSCTVKAQHLRNHGSHLSLKCFLHQ